VKVTHLVPGHEAVDGGVLAYARALAIALSQRTGVANHLLCVGTDAESRAEGEGARVESTRRGSASALLGRLDGDSGAVLVHYANYGYAARGCPGYLATALERWSRKENRGRLVTFFHEVYATGKPWQSSFWLSPLQRRIAARVARVSDGLLTSLDLYASLLRRLTPTRSVAVVPVFSTIGEPEALPPMTQRRRRLVVFGGRGSRSLAYGEKRQALETTCRLLEIEEVVDVGPPVPMPGHHVAERPLRPLGMLPAPEVSALLRESLAGFLAYPPAFLGKSTVFASYCAHGVVPVCAWRNRDGSEELRAGEHYWYPHAGLDHDREALEGIARTAHSWYATHDLASQATLFAGLLCEPRGRTSGG
jgi:hypothetical protein